MTDTDFETAEVLVQGYRAMKPQERLDRACAMSRAVVQLAAARIEKARPGISEREMRLRLGSLWLDRGTMMRAFGWDPEKEGY
jgi:hypothetical protein